MNARHEITSTVFDSLRAGQRVRVSFAGCMSAGANLTLKVGRRSRSKKWNTDSITLEPANGAKVSPMAKLRLLHRCANGSVTLAQGDMATTVTAFEIIG